MLEALIIFNQGGIVLFQYRAEPSLLKSVDQPAAHVRHLLEAEVIHDALLGSSYHDTTQRFKIVDGLTFCWAWSAAAAAHQDHFCVAAVYPDILFEGPRQYLKHWAQYLVAATAVEFRLLYDRTHSGKPHGGKNNNSKNSEDGNSSSSTRNKDMATLLSGSAFEKTFKVVLEHSKTQRHNEPTAAVPGAVHDGSSSSSTTNNASTVKESAATGGAAAAASPTKKEPSKERHWRGEAKVTEAAMNALNMNEDAGDSKNNEAAYQRALDEARQAYLPSKDEVKQSSSSTAGAANKDETTTSWSSALTGMLQTLSGSKRLTVDDLQKPLEKVKAHLQEKNVSVETADALCQAVRQKLVGRQLQSFYSVQTAVQQAFEATIAQLLLKPVDLVTNVRRKRNKPYVICVMGINGIGKTTTTAKLAYHFQQKGLNSLLVAADTFRAGAVEQLRVHADCLGVPIYTAGYAKDPTDVVTQALQQLPTMTTTTTGNNNNKPIDVVLIDTAGRMQTNAPLMQSMSKLIRTHTPDFTILVCEALVGSDALSQFQVFQKAAGKIDGLILTKVDTVDKKLGAALTLTQQSRTPVVFCGVGQKYHHLEPLDVDRVVRALLS